MEDLKTQAEILNTKEFGFELIKQINAGEKIEDLVNKYNIDCTTIRDIYSKNANEYIQFCQKTFTNPSNFSNRLEKCSDRFTSKDEYLNYLLRLWCKQQKTNRIPITKYMLKKRAHIIHKQVYAQEASDSWYEEFTKKFYVEDCVHVEKVSSINKEQTIYEKEKPNINKPIPNYYAKRKNKKSYNFKTKVPHESTMFKNSSIPPKRSCKHSHTNKSSFKIDHQPYLNEETSSDEMQPSFLCEQYSSCTDDFVITNVQSCVEDDQSFTNEQHTSTSEQQDAINEQPNSTENVDMEENGFSEQLQCFNSMLLAEIKQIKSERILRKLKLDIMKSIWDAQEEDAQLY